MARTATKKTATKRTTGTKARAKSTAGRKATASPQMPRSPKKWAAMLEKIEARRSGFIRAVWSELKTGSGETPAGPTRVAQDMPRAGH